LQKASEEDWTFEVDEFSDITEKIYMLKGRARDLRHPVFQMFNGGYNKPQDAQDPMKVTNREIRRLGTQKEETLSQFNNAEVMRKFKNNF
jgi:hypothetical protein